MKPSEYQRLAARTLLDAPERPLTPQEHMIVWTAVGLAGEAGEVLELLTDTIAVKLAAAACHIAEQIKKGIFHEKGLDMEVVLHNLVELFEAAGYIARQTSDPPDYEYFRRVRKELGDVCWYAAALCTKLGIDMNMLIDMIDEIYLTPIFVANLEKLEKRLPNGWNTADAAARADEAPE